MTQKYNIIKSTVEVYKLRLKEGGGYWADITIDARGTTGRISIASDYGNWQNYWGACGRSFKEFLCTIDIDYAAGKFGENRHFNIEETCNAIRVSIREETPANKSDLLRDLRKVEQESSTENDFIHSMYNHHKLLDFCGGNPSLVRSITPQFKRFWKEVWPELINEFKRELTEKEENT